MKRLEQEATAVGKYMGRQVVLEKISRTVAILQEQRDEYKQLTSCTSGKPATATHCWQPI